MVAEAEPVLDQKKIALYPQGTTGVLAATVVVVPLVEAELVVEV